ncbi:hypothetical protein EON68_00330 [archaeon]|nr:MAG: hypothetical protein EON68_00330 [archaeon]
MCGVALGREYAVMSLPSNTFVDDADAEHAPPSGMHIIHEAEPVYDAAWLPTSQHVVTVQKGLPLHAWRVEGAAPREEAHYCVYNRAAELTTAYSCAVSAWGERLYAGAEESISVFDVARAGRPLAAWCTRATKRSVHGQAGIISTLSAHPCHASLLLAGSLRGSVAVYDASAKKLVATLPCGSEAMRTARHVSCARARVAPATSAQAAFDPSARPGVRAGITHVRWSTDGWSAFGGFRGRNGVCQWDMRMLSGVPSADADAPLRGTPAVSGKGSLVAVYERAAESMQRLQFDVAGSAAPHAATHPLLVSGTSDARLLVYDTTALECVALMTGFTDAASCVALHPAGVAMAVATGARHAPTTDAEDDEESRDSEAAGARARPRMNPAAAGCAPSKRRRVGSEEDAAPSRTDSDALVPWRTAAGVHSHMLAAEVGGAGVSSTQPFVHDVRSARLAASSLSLWRTHWVTGAASADGDGT